jgi:RHS repeat-associated protein
MTATSKGLPMVAAATISRASRPSHHGCARLKSEAESSAASIPRGCHGRAGRASATNAENACERFFWALQGVNFNVYGLVSHSGDLVERYEYTPYGRRTVYSRGWLRCDLNGDGVVSSADLTAFDEADSGPNEGASIADVRGQGYLSEDAREEDIQERIGLSVADDPLVMHSRLESFRLEWLNGPYWWQSGAAGSLCDIGHQGLLHDKEFGPAATGLVHNRRRTLNPLLARFNQRDSKNGYKPKGGYQDGMNLYECVRSLPNMERDPSGFGIATPGGASGASIHQNAAGEWEVSRGSVTFTNTIRVRPQGFRTAQEVANMRNKGMECIPGESETKFVMVVWGKCIKLGFVLVLEDSVGNKYCAYLCHEKNAYRTRKCSRQGRWRQWTFDTRLGDVYIGALCYPPCAAIGKVLYKGDNGLPRLGSGKAADA